MNITDLRIVLISVVSPLCVERGMPASDTVTVVKWSPVRSIRDKHRVVGHSHGHLVYWEVSNKLSIGLAMLLKTRSGITDGKSLECSSATEHLFFLTVRWPRILKRLNLSFNLAGDDNHFTKVFNHHFINELYSKRQQPCLRYLQSLSS